VFDCFQFLHMNRTSKSHVTLTLTSVLMLIYPVASLQPVNDELKYHLLLSCTYRVAQKIELF